MSGKTYLNTMRRIGGRGLWPYLPALLLVLWAALRILI